MRVIPASLNELPEFADLPPSRLDQRVPANLVDGTNDSTDGAHSWLAPLASTMPRDGARGGKDADNIVYFVFDQPVLWEAWVGWCARRLLFPARR
jgi:hypothetical protein